MRALALLADLREAGIAFAGADDLARWLGPALCATMREQQRFRDLVRQYAAEKEAQARAEAASRARPLLDNFRGAVVGNQVKSSLSDLATGAIGLAVLTGLGYLIYSLLAGGGNLQHPPEQTSGLATDPDGLPTQALFDLWRTLTFSLTGLTLAALPLAAALLFLVWWRGRDIALSRRMLAGAAGGSFVQIARAAQMLFPPARFRRVVRLIAGHRQVPSLRLHIEETLRATIKAAGRVHLRFGTRPALPEHLILIERATSADHVGLLGDVIAERLAAGGVHLTAYEFDQDPRLLRQAGRERYESLRDVAGRFFGQRAIVIGDGARFLGLQDWPHRWVKPAFEGFAAVVLLTPVPEPCWGEREEALARAGFRLFPATGDGLERMASALAKDGVLEGAAALRSDDQVEDFVRRLDSGRGRWLSDTPPPPEEVRNLILELRAWLDDDGFMLLAGLAMFPVVRGEVTLALADALEIRPETTIGGSELIAELARLPWLRQGRIPDWLRVELLKALPPASAETVRDAYRRLFEQAQGVDVPGASSVEIVAGAPSFRLGWNDLTGKSSTVDRRERIAWDFVRGRKLELQAPQAFACILRTRWEPAEAAVAVLAVAASLLLGVFERKLWDAFIAAATVIVTTIGEERLRVVGWSAGGLSLLMAFRAFAGDWGQAQAAEGVATARAFLFRTLSRVSPRFIPPDKPSKVSDKRGASRLSLTLALVSAAAGLLLFADSTDSTLLISGLIVVFAALTLRAEPTHAAAQRAGITLADLFTGDRTWRTTAILAVPVTAFAYTGMLAPWAQLHIGAPVDELLLIVGIHFAALVTLGVLAATRLRLHWTEVLCVAAAMTAAQILLVQLLDGPPLPAFDTQQAQPDPMGTIAVASELLALSVSVYSLPLELLVLLIALRRLDLLPAKSGGRAFALFLAFVVAFPAAIFAMGIDALPIAMLFTLVLQPLLVAATVFVGPGAFSEWLASPRRTKIGLGAEVFTKARLLILSGVFGFGAALLFVLDWPSEVAGAYFFAALPWVFLWPTLRRAMPEAQTEFAQAADGWDQIGSPWIWWLAPVLFAFLGFHWGDGPLNVDIHHAWLPVAAWLGARHGRQGFTLVAVAGAPLLVGVSMSGIGSGNIGSVGNLGLYLTALAVCRLFGQSESYLKECLSADQLTARALAFLFLVLAADFYSFARIEDLTINVGGSLAAYFWFVLFVIGLSANPLGRVVLLLALAATVGWLLLVLEATPSIDNTRLYYRVLGPQAFVTGAVALWLGRLVRNRLLLLVNVFGNAAAQPTLPLLLGLLALGILGSCLQLDLRTILPLPRTTLLFGTGTATAMLLFATGFAGGSRGALLAAALWLGAALFVPFVMAEFSQITTQGASPVGALRFGPLIVMSPPGLLGTRLQLVPGIAIAPLDVIFPILGWLLARRLGLVGPARQGEAPPPQSETPVIA